MIDLLFWFAQDFLTVLSSGVLQIPEIFLGRLIFRLLTEERESYVPLIWIAFVGGLCWDLRWVGVPGFFALTYVGVVLAVLCIWNMLPTSGRTLGVVLFLFWVSQLVPALLYVFLLAGGVGDVRWTLFGLQQLSVIPLLLGAVFLYMRNVKVKNA